jgi:hypothetical protein
MNFIESVFGISPDFGSGVLEAAILLVAIFVPAAVTIWRVRRRSGLRTS